MAFKTCFFLTVVSLQANNPSSYIKRRIILNPKGQGEAKKNRIRLGIVKYLNTKPLVYSIEKGKFEHLFSCDYDVPSACASKLAKRENDLAVIPAIEYAGNDSYRIVPDISISSFGKVDSVILFVPKEKSLKSIQKITLDSSSRTSANLLRILCRKKFGIDPDFFSADPETPRIFENSDAVLLIGDPALYLSDARYRRVDLGEEWTSLTGLPFVYALWSGWEGNATREHIAALLYSKEAGMKNIKEIAKNYAGGDEKRYQLNFRYLTRNTRYNLGNLEIKGLEKYFEWAQEYNLINRIPRLKFYD